MALRQAAALVRAAIGDGEELALEIEDDDRAALHLDQLAAAGRDLGDGGDDVLGHLAFLPETCCTHRGHFLSPPPGRAMSGTGMPPSIALQRVSSAFDFFSASSSTSRMKSRGMKHTPVSSATTRSPAATRTSPISTSPLISTVSIRHLPVAGVISLDQIG